MSNSIRRFLLLSAVLAVAGCAEPYPLYYTPMSAPPLQPYMGPTVAAPAVVTKRVVKRRYVRRHRRVHCRCSPSG